MSKNVTFIIDNNGNVKIDKVEGYGSSCLDATKFLEERLGGVEESTRELTEEYNEPITGSAGEIEI
jgi:hypothetical protein